MISSHPEWPTYKAAPIRGNWLQRWWKSRFRFVDYPFLLAYRGFGSPRKAYVQGHVCRGMALHRPRTKQSAWKNFWALVKLYLVRTVPKAEVVLTFEGQRYVTETNQRGFFEFTIVPGAMRPGWHTCHLELRSTLVEGQEVVEVETEVLIAEEFPFGLISDVDDTFLVSHVTKRTRKLYTLLTKNARTRRPVEGVVDFYRALTRVEHGRPNPMFYVSSSEWNLYEFLVNFTKWNHLPKGVLQLKRIKNSPLDFLRSGFGSHEHKYDKMMKVLELFPDRQFILIGDNGQHDPQLYLRAVRQYRDQIKGVYIRGVKRSHREAVDKLLVEVTEAGIPALQFVHVREALTHARQQGWIE